MNNYLWRKYWSWGRKVLALWNSLMMKIKTKSWWSCLSTKKIIHEVIFIYFQEQILSMIFSIKQEANFLTSGLLGFFLLPPWAPSSDSAVFSDPLNHLAVNGDWSSLSHFVPYSRLFTNFKNFSKCDKLDHFWKVSPSLP